MPTKASVPRLPLFPATAAINAKDHLTVGGCDTVDLVKEYGTPLYVYDETGLRQKCAEFKNEFTRLYPNTTVLYASKAFINPAMASIFKSEGLGLDVVSGGEMSIAASVGYSMDKLYFHGNNKSAEELRQAIDLGVGRIVVDNAYELALLDRIAGEKKRKVDILLRINPGIDPHTHKYNTTGIIDSKFGVPSAFREEVVASAMKAANLKLVGLHFHLGSLILETDCYSEGIKLVLDFAAAMKQKYGFELKEFDVGGGYGVPYTLEQAAGAPPVSAFAGVITSTLKAKCADLKLALPRLLIEPGRAIVARSCLSLYTVGVVKEIPGVRCYVSVDGGMGDNIRQALYGAKHEAVVANRVSAKEGGPVTIAGKFCESGDILIRDIPMPPVAAGDIISLADCGAYCIPMSSNYNAFCRPAVVMVKDGKFRLIRRRETYADLTKCDVV